MIKVKRVYDEARIEDGYRILVDRLWPRGLSKVISKIDLWLKEIAPSDELRKWFSHDPGKWEDFQRRYAKELSSKEDLVKRIGDIEREKRTVTILFSAREERYNNAVALRNALKLQRSRGGKGLEHND